MRKRLATYDGEPEPPRHRLRAVLSEPGLRALWMKRLGLPVIAAAGAVAWVYIA